MIFAEDTSFCDNHAGMASGSLCISSGSNATFIEGRTDFIKNRGEYSAGTICVRNSYLNFHGNVTILENMAYRGGGLSLYSGSIMIINPNAYINFTGNRAMHQGGAVYVQEKDDYSFRHGGTQCFFRPIGESQGTIYFQGNYAKTAGSALCGAGIS